MIGPANTLFPIGTRNNQYGFPLRDKVVRPNTCGGKCFEVRTLVSIQLNNVADPKLLNSARVRYHCLVFGRESSVHDAALDVAPSTRISNGAGEISSMPKMCG